MPTTRRTSQRLILMPRCSQRGTLTGRPPSSRSRSLPLRLRRPDNPPGAIHQTEWYQPPPAASKSTFGQVTGCRGYGCQAARVVPAAAPEWPADAAILTERASDKRGGSAQPWRPARSARLATRYCDSARRRSSASTSLTRRLVADMVETMRAADGMGLAAPQVGVSSRVIVAEVDDEDYVLINPESCARRASATSPTRAA